ncbi:MAG: hypothetical protein ACOYIK_08925 [Coriobacteriales bacterium]|jgi:hypothetical protein
MKKKISIMVLTLVLSAFMAFAVCGCSSSGTDATSEISNGTVADGSYTIEVALNGGSGKATIDSPTSLEVSDGTMTATITWSSPNYDKMVVDGVEYDPVNEDPSSNSEFQIPVSKLDTALNVQAETTAMSEPHMIDYTLTFDSTTLKYA